VYVRLTATGISNPEARPWPVPVVEWSNAMMMMMMSSAITYRFLLVNVSCALLVVVLSADTGKEVKLYGSIFFVCNSYVSKTIALALPLPEMMTLLKTVRIG